MKIINIVILLMILLVLPVAFAVDFGGLNMTASNYFYTGFDYSSTFTTRGWYYSVTSCNANYVDHPTNGSYYANYSGCALQGTRDLIAANFSISGAAQDFSQKDHFSLSYRYYVNPNAETNIRIRDAVAGNIKVLITNSGITGTTDVLFNELGAVNCSFGSLADQWNTFDIYIDRAGKIYYVKENGILLCNGNIPTAAVNWKAFYFTMNFQNTSLRIEQIDDILLNTSERVEQAVISSYGSNVIWSDDFNYVNSLYSQKGWLVLEPGLGVDTTFAPIDNKLVFTDYSYKSPTHTTGAYSYTYMTGHNLYVTSTEFAPVFSSDMIVNITSTLNDAISSCFEYIARNGADELVYDIRLCPNASAYYYNDAGTGFSLCDGCVPKNTDFQFKVITYLSQKPGMPFNSTVTADKISVFINGTNYDITPSYWSDKITRVSQYYIVKNNDAQFKVDDYFVYVGTDQYVNNLDFYFTPSYNPVNETIIVPTDSFDLVENIQSLYNFLGLRTVASRVFFGLILIALMNVLLLWLAFSYDAQIPAFAYMVLNIVCVIGLIYIGLLPFWIPIVIGVVVIGGVMFMFLKAISSGG